MRTITLSIILVLISYNVFTQVGVGTTNPSAALDIKSKGTDNNTTKAIEINNSTKELATVLDNGNVGIGVSNPLAKLEINGLSGIVNFADKNLDPASQGNTAFFLPYVNSGNLLVGWNRKGGNAEIDFINARVNSAGGFAWYDLGTDNTLTLNATLLNQNLSVQNNITAIGTITAKGVVLTSDKRLKTKIKQIDNAIVLINKLNPVHYLKKTNLEATKYDKKEFGFIAQEVQKFLPELVSESKESKTLGVDYISLIAILTKALKEQQELIKTNSKEIEALKEIILKNKN